MSDQAPLPVRTSFLVHLALGSLLLAVTASPGFAQFGNPGGLPTAIAIDVQTAELDGSFLRNGTLFGPDYLDGGRIEVESNKGDATTFGLSWDQTYGPLQLIQGRYTPRFSSFFEPLTAPRAYGQAFAPATDLLEDQTWNPDVPAVRVQFSFLLNGESFPGASSEIADFYLRDVESGREIPIGTSQDGSTRIFIVPGTYDVIYAHRSGLTIPANTHARVLAAVEITEDMTLIVDVPMALRSFFYFLNGEPFPMNDIYTHAQIFLDNPETGDSIYLGRTTGPDFHRLIPGTYRALYTLREGYGVLPINKNAVVDDALVIAPTGATTVDVQVSSHIVDPEFQIDGGSSELGSYEYGEVYLDSGNGDRFKIGDTRSDPDPIHIVASTYDAYYEIREGGTLAPRNPDSRFAQDLVVDANEPLVLNIETALLTLDLELNGERFPLNQYEAGRIRVVDPHTGAEIIAGSTTSAPFLMRLIRGNYDVVYEFREGGEDVPVNRNHVIAPNLPVQVSATQVINVEMQRISPGFALNGDDFPTSATEYGEFSLRGPNGDRFSLGFSNEEPLDYNVIESAYAVDYEWRDGETVPINKRETVQIISVPEAGFAPGLLVAALMMFGAGRSRFAAGARLQGRSRHAGIRRATPGSVITDRMRIPAPQPGQRSASTSKTRCQQIRPTGRAARPLERRRRRHSRSAGRRRGAPHSFSDECDHGKLTRAEWDSS